MLNNTVSITGYGHSHIRTRAVQRKVVGLRWINGQVFCKCEIGTTSKGIATHSYPLRRLSKQYQAKVTRPAPKPCTALMIRPVVSLMEVAA